MSFTDRQYSTEGKEEPRLGYMPFLVMGLIVLAVVIILVVLWVGIIL